MVISNKPLRFILATLVACLPLISFANPEQDTAKVKQKPPWQPKELMLNQQM
jgi:F-type H+-transporting ATPase subunit a